MKHTTNQTEVVGSARKRKLRGPGILAVALSAIALSGCNNHAAAPVTRAAIVRTEVGGTAGYRIMLFENGNWVMKPTDGFAAHLGEPVEQIVAEEKAAGLC